MGAQDAQCQKAQWTAWICSHRTSSDRCEASMELWPHHIFLEPLGKFLQFSKVPLQGLKNAKLANLSGLMQITHRKITRELPTEKGKVEGLKASVIMLSINVSRPWHPPGPLWLSAVEKRWKTTSDYAFTTLRPQTIMNHRNCHNHCELPQSTTWSQMT